MILQKSTGFVSSLPQELEGDKGLHAFHSHQRSQWRIGKHKQPIWSRQSLPCRLWLAGRMFWAVSLQAFPCLNISLGIYFWSLSEELTGIWSKLIQFSYSQRLGIQAVTIFKKKVRNLQWMPLSCHVSYLLFLLQLCWASPLYMYLSDLDPQLTQIPPSMKENPGAEWD